MSNNDLAIVILAAGKGTRLKSSLAKVLHRAGGRTLVEQIVRSCEPLKARQTVIVVGHQAEQVAAIVEPLGALTVLQHPQNGTGHALQVAKRALGRAKFAVVLPGDAPLVRTDTLKALVAAHRNGNAAATILSAVLADPSGYGRVVRKSETAVSAIIEESQLSDEQREINEINSAIYCFRLEKLWPALARVKPNNKHRELYLTDTIAALNAKGETVLAQVAADSREVLGCNTRADLAEVDRVFRERKRQALMDDGVTIQLPETVLIDPEVTAGEDTIIEPGVQLLGKTKIGARCTIRTGSVLTDAILGDDVTVEPHCVVARSRLDDRVIIGPFARLRPDNHVKAGARIGNFVELKKSTIGEGTKAKPCTSRTWATRRSEQRATSAQARLPATTTAFTSIRRRSGTKFSSAAIRHWSPPCVSGTARTSRPVRRSRPTCLPMVWASPAAARSINPAGPQRNAVNWPPPKNRRNQPGAAQRKNLSEGRRSGGK